MAKYSNTLTSHCGESMAHDIKKMFTKGKPINDYWVGKSKRSIKNFTKSKNRQTIKRLNREELNETNLR